MERILQSLSETSDFAKVVAARLSPGDSLGLIGELGVGKTTFVRELVGALGSSDLATSPTFVLQHLYSTSAGTEIEHWDLYRMASLPGELLEPPGPATIRLIEWPDKFENVLERLEATVSFHFGSSATERLVEFKTRCRAQ